MIIRMTEKRWINFDNVKRIVVLDYPGKLKVFFSGQRNSEISFDLEDGNEAKKVANEIGAIIATGKIVRMDASSIERDKEGPLIKNGKLGKVFRGGSNDSRVETMWEGKVR